MIVADTLRSVTSFVSSFEVNYTDGRSSQSRLFGCKSARLDESRAVLEKLSSGAKGSPVFKCPGLAFHKLCLTRS